MHKDTKEAFELGRHLAREHLDGRSVGFGLAVGLVILGIIFENAPDATDRKRMLADVVQVLTQRPWRTRRYYE